MRAARRGLRRARLAVGDFLDHHPFASALIVMTAVIVPGAWRLEQANDKAQQAVGDLAAFVAAEADEDAAQALRGCQQRNGGFVAIREAHVRFVDELAAIFAEGAADPSGVEAAAARLRDRGVPPPEETDRDCDGDGALDSDDYDQ